MSGGTSIDSLSIRAESPPAGRVALGVFDIACVVIGGIIGVGIFFTPREVARAVDGPGQVVAAWGLGGVMAIVGALVFAALASRVPGHGGTFTYIHDAFGRWPAFLYGWANWLVIQSGAMAVIGLVMVDYAGRLLLADGASLSPLVRVVVASATVLVFTATNAFGLQFGRWTQNVLTVIKVAAVFALVALGVVVAGGAGAAVPVATSSSEPRGWLLGIAAAILPVMFSFGGWQQGSFLAGAARRPRDVSVGILVGVGVVVVAYLTVNIAFLRLLGFEGARAAEAIGADAAAVVLGEAGGRVLAAMVVVSSLGIINTICLAPPYVLHAMAARGLFPAVVGRLHPVTGTPVVGVVVQGTWAVVLLWSAWVFGDQPIEFLVNGVVFVDWLFFGLCGLACVRLCRAAGGAFGASAIAGASFSGLALLVMVGAVWAMPLPSVAGLGMCALGIPVFLRLRNRSRVTYR